jgi:hypothetical protein
MRAFAKTQATRIQALLSQREAGAMLISVLFGVMFVANGFSGGLSA